MSKHNFQEIQEIGFAALIDRISKFSGVRRPEVERGIGDDAAVIAVGNDKHELVTSEIFLEGVHFDLTYHPFKHLGYKLVTAAVSDNYAMNGTPVHIQINIAVPNKYSVQMVEQFYQGIEQGCNDYNIQVSGGDTTASHQFLAIAVTCCGTANKKETVYRDGAKNEDLVCVTGDLGSALAGLRILMREKADWKESGEQHFQPDLDDYSYVIQRQLLPAARKDVINSFNKHSFKPHAMIDVTQGLVANIRDIAVSSGLGAELFLPAVPISLETRRVADEMKEDVDKYAFYGGEDFELLFTIPENKTKQVEDILDDFTVIGRMSDEYSNLKINTGENETIEIELD